MTRAPGLRPTGKAAVVARGPEHRPADDAPVVTRLPGRRSSAPAAVVARAPGRRPPGEAAVVTRLPGRGRGGSVVVSAVVAAALLGCALLAGLVGVAPAQAAGYRYWSFWDLDGGRWTYATQGPSQARPEDGAVQGFRFSVSEDSADSARPRGAHGFAAICGGTPPKQGTKRIALVVDFGSAADAPSGETPPRPRTACARVAADASSAEALAAVAKPLRYDGNALLCAIAGYPHAGCGDEVPAAKAPGPERGTAHHIPSAGLIAGIVAVSLLGVAAIWQSRRHRG